MTESETSVEHAPGPQPSRPDTPPPAPVEEAEDPRTARRRLAAAWLWPASAVGAMIATGWYDALRNGGAPGGDMLGHAGAAEWFRTLPWWDWRGWSDWFYGGQAMGVSYPPLSHAWLRFTDPYHGQMVAVALGLLVLLPWGSLRLARAVGCGPRAQRGAVAAVLVLTAASAKMHWLLSGFHSEITFFGSWPAMIATVLGLHCAAWAARCQRPTACGIVLGVAVLANASIVPGIVVVCAALLANSGVSLFQGLRYGASTLAAAAIVCAWWLVPFMAGWSRLIRWDVPLADAWSTGGVWMAAVLALTGVAAAWAARLGGRGARRLASAALAGLAATVVAEYFGYLRPERWLQMPLLVAAAAAGCLLASSAFGATSERPGRPRPAWNLLGTAFVVVLVVITSRLELVPLAVWLLASSPRREWAWGGALAWASVLAWVPIAATIVEGSGYDRPSTEVMEAVAERAAPDSHGLVFTASIYKGDSGDVSSCDYGDPWRVAADTGGSVRPLLGLYGATSASTEFLDAEANLRHGTFREEGGRRPHWASAWQDAGKPLLHTPAAAEAMGARWYVVCDDKDGVDVRELRGVSAVGVEIVPLADEQAWHRSATSWWIAAAAGALGRDAADAAVPVLAAGGVASRSPADSASGLTMESGQDRLTLRVESPGWAWLRVPWDPWWRADTGSPVLKGGPGHLIVWAEQGTTVLRWSVPGPVDAAAAAATGISLAVATGLAVVNRRYGFEIDSVRRRPVAAALEIFADTVDQWWRAAVRSCKRLAARRRIR